MATGVVKSWNGQTGLIISDDYEDKIVFNVEDFQQNYEPNIGDKLTFKVKKVNNRSEGSTTLHAKKIKYTDFNYDMHPHERKGNPLPFVIVVLTLIAGAAFWAYKQGLL